MVWPQATNPSPQHAFSAPDLRRPCKISTRIQAQLLLHQAAVSANFWITPRYNSPSFKNGSKKHRELLGCAGLSSAALEPGCCLHQNSDDPKSEQPQIGGWQQKHRQLLVCAGRSSAALAPGCCLRHSLDDPRSQQPQIQVWQQQHRQLLVCAVPSCSCTRPLCPP